MSNNTCQINTLSQSILNILETEKEDIKNIVDEEIENTTNDILEYLSTSKDVPERTKSEKSYKKSFYKKSNSKSHFKLSIIANKKYTLTHLLEYGHLTKNKANRTRAFPHWSKAQKIAETVDERIERRLKNDT